MLRRTLAAVMTVLVLATGVAACSGDDEPSATEKARQQTCSDIDTFKSSVDSLVQDIKKGNFGDAKDDLSKVQSSFQSLTKSAKNLASSKKSDVQTQLDDVKTTLDGIKTASSLTDIQDVIDQAGSQLSDQGSTITDTLSC